MKEAVFASGPFRGVSVTDAFAAAAMQETPVVVNLSAIAWPTGLAPTSVRLGQYRPGAAVTGSVQATADVLILLYTYELRALLDVWTGNSSWTPARRQTWNPYAHNFDQIKGQISDVRGNDALEAGYFGYLAAFRVGGANVVLYKTELHPKSDGTRLPFITVITQLVSELKPKMTVSTGTAGAIGAAVNCGDVAITTRARFHCKKQYPDFPKLNRLSASGNELTNVVKVDTRYIEYAASHFTKLSLPGLAACYGKIAGRPGYGFLKKNVSAPQIYVTDIVKPVGPQPMDIVSADYLTVDDHNNTERLQELGIMNDTDDAFAFYAIQQLPPEQHPKWLSVRNASEPQINFAPFPPGTSQTEIINSLKSTAGAIYGVYQYCTTLNSAFACWGLVAAMG